MINFQQLFILGMLSATIHWVVARASITARFWRLLWLPHGALREFLNELLSCPACSGFWIGLAFGFAGLQPIQGSFAFVQILAAGFASLFLTPVFEGVFLWGLRASAIDD
jgi:hypothetical protein